MIETIGKFMSSIMEMPIGTIIIAFTTAVLGYMLGTSKLIREHKLNFYSEVLPVFLRATFSGKKEDEIAFNSALVRMWIYAGKKAAKALDTAVSCTVNPNRGNPVEKLKEAISAVRRDIQPWWRWRNRKLSPEDIKHIYATLRNSQPELPPEHLPSPLP